MVTQNHSGSGHNINANTVNFGRPEFVLTEQVLGQIGDHFAGVGQIKIGWVGSQKSHQMSERIATHLESLGKQVERMGGVGMRIPQLETAIEITGNVITVDSSK